MKAMVLRAPGGLDRIELIDAASPPLPRSGEITVCIQASCINYHDLGVALGLTPLAPTADGLVLLGDASGIVEAVGADVVDFVPSDAVVSCIFPQWQHGPPQVSDFSSTPGDGVDGFAREYVTLPASAFTRAPEGYSAAEAATLTTAGVTAWRALMVNGPLKASDTVLVQGSGGVSIFALQIAHAVGARVIATSSSDEKLERLRALGASYTINYRNQPEWGQLAFEWTEGRGVDHVIDVGGPATLSQSMGAVSIGGISRRSAFLEA